MNFCSALTSLVRKIAAAKKEAAKTRAGKNSFPPTPFLFARPSVQFGARSAPSVPFKIGSDFVKQTHINVFLYTHNLSLK